MSRWPRIERTDDARQTFQRITEIIRILYICMYINIYICIVNDQNQVSCVEGGQQCPSAAVMTHGTKDVGRVPRCGIVGKGRKWLDHQVGWSTTK